MTQKDLLSRLADAGEEAIQRLASVPGTEQLLGVVTSLRDRMDEMQRRMRGIDSLERRVDELERRLDAMGGAGAASTTAQAADVPPSLGTGSSVGAAAPLAGTAAEPEPPPADVGTMEPPLETGASLGDMSGTSMPEPPPAGDVGMTDEPPAAGDVGATTGAGVGTGVGTTEPPSAGDLGTTEPASVGDVGSTEPSFSTGPSVGATAQMTGATTETPDIGDASAETEPTPAAGSEASESSSSSTGGDRPA